MGRDGAPALPHRVGQYRRGRALPPKTYRMVICGDVLEHVPDPVGVLRKLKDAATDDAVFVVSVPNVAHLAVRLMLLFGYFPKMDRGILDRTHLHFFTRDTAEAMLRDAGLRVTRVTSTGVPLDEPARGAGEPAVPRPHQVAAPRAGGPPAALRDAVDPRRRARAQQQQPTAPTSAAAGAGTR